MQVNGNEHVVVPTGIRCAMQPGWVLMLFPRSSRGFRYQMRLDNTAGIIDEDYHGAELSLIHICYIVVGRSITKRADPAKTYREIEAMMR